MSSICTAYRGVDLSNDRTQNPFFKETKKQMTDECEFKVLNSWKDVLDEGPEENEGTEGCKREGGKDEEKNGRVTKRNGHF
jgi:hypothetical protein